MAQYVEVAPTEHRIISTGADGRWAGYLVQHCYRPDLLVENILAGETPAADRPIVTAVRDAALAAVADGSGAIDSQFSNFVWDQGVLTTIDCGSPFLYHDDGSADYEIGAYSSAMPSVLRPVVVRLARKVVDETGTANGNPSWLR
ncbi:MAG: hypothetical protein AAFP84_10140 [Actinomycetota bacterium]